MPRAKPAQRPDDPPEWVAHAFRFSCGAVFGAVVSLTSFFFISLSQWYWVLAIALVLAVACGYLAMRYGDDFWHWLADNWWFWR